MGDISISDNSISTKMTITHIVLFKYFPTITWTDLQSHFDEFLKLKERCVKPGESTGYMVSMRAGKNNSWESYSKGMTHGFVLEFENQAGLDYYLTEDPVHLEFSKNAKLLIEDSVVVDITDGVLFGPSPVRPVKLYHGSCHCEQVAWEVNLEISEHILCHCDTCKKLGGGPFSLNQIVKRNDLRVTRGSLKAYVYRGASGKQVHCYFCGNCTSHAYHHQEVMGDQIIVRTALLEGGNKMGVAAEIFPEGQLAWVRDLAKALPSS